jgi:hypothetical protein
VLLVMLLAGLSRVAVRIIHTHYNAAQTSIGVVTKCSQARSGLGLDGLESACPKEVTRLLEYCNTHAELPAGQEGPASPPPAAAANFPGAEKYEMEHLVLLIRHGDRSAIHEIPGTATAPGGREDVAHGSDTPIATHAAMQHPLHGSKFLDVRALDFLPRLSNFKVKHMPDADASIAALPLVQADKDGSPWSSGGAAIDPKSMFNALDGGILFQKGDLLLPPGKLTSRGFMQHVLLGGQLQKAYRAFLQRHVLTPANVRVRSTNYDRTIQSAAALLLGLLPDVGGVDAPIDIRVYKAESLEVMHGIQARCQAAVSQAAAEKASYALPGKVQQRMVDVFAEGVKGTFVTEMTDAALPKLCHNRHLPCRVGEGPETCMTEEDLGQLMVNADRAFCGRYTGSKGGRASTRLNVYPFLQQVMQALEEGGATSPPAADADAAAAAAADEARAARARLTLFSGHDTVIAPVLEGLGLYEGGSRCKWPPYAARIAFELWRKELTAGGTGTGTGTGTQTDADGGGALFVRVVYNGQDLTADIPACRGASPCPLQAVQGQVAALLPPATSLQEACKGAVV